MLLVMLPVMQFMDFINKKYLMLYITLVNALEGLSNNFKMQFVLKTRFSVP